MDLGSMASRLQSGLAWPPFAYLIAVELPILARTILCGCTSSGQPFWAVPREREGGMGC